MKYGLFVVTEVEVDKMSRPCREKCCRSLPCSENKENDL